MLWTKIKYRLALVYSAFLLKIGFQKLLLRNRYGERILVFHGIDTTGETRFNSRFVSKAYFEKFIVYITKHYNIISLDDFYQKKFKPNTLNIALTFDDGYLNNYTHAIPILKKHNVPACFYITPIHKKDNFLWCDFLDLVCFHSKKTDVLFEGNLFVKNNKNEFVYHGTSLKTICKTLPYNKISPLYEIFKEEWEDLQPKSLEEYWKLMSIDQIKEIANDSLFTIGSHSLTHANLAEINPKEAYEEILSSKKILEDICGHTIDEFAFPFGTYTNATVDYCKSLGFKKILLVDYNNKVDEKDSILLKRFVINPYISIQYQLVCLLKNSYF